MMYLDVGEQNSEHYTVKLIICVGGYVHIIYSQISLVDIKYANVWFNTLKFEFFLPYTQEYFTRFEAKIPHN